MKYPTHILLGMSGGVDSSAAARLLLETGYTVQGLFCIMHDHAAAELSDARVVAEKLGIPLHTADLRGHFERLVVHDFIDAYRHGRTPNPCIICNPLVKFRALCDYADRLGCEKIATGHYAGVAEEGGRFFVVKSRVKDQSYMLCRLPQAVLSRLMLPLCGREKAQVRALAAQLALPVADKPDSQDLCFIRNESYFDFLRRRGVTNAPGDFVLANTGQTVGRHDGIFRYTIGQRKNLGIALGRPVFVCGRDAAANRVLLEFDDPVAKTAAVRELIWQARAYAPGESFGAAVKTRFSAAEQPARIDVLEGDRAQIAFAVPVRALTPGQSAVFYDGDRLVGAGILECPSCP